MGVVVGWWWGGRCGVLPVVTSCCVVVEFESQLVLRASLSVFFFSPSLIVLMVPADVKQLLLLLSKCLTDVSRRSQRRSLAVFR